MVVEGRDFERFDLRQPQLVGECMDHRDRQAAFGVLDPVQVLDQQIRLPGVVSEQTANRLPSRLVQGSLPLARPEGRLNSTLRIPEL